MTLHTTHHALAYAPGVPETHRHILMVTTRPEDTDLAALVEPDAISAVLVHHGNLTWPDAAGVKLARETLALEGVVAMAFKNALDAIAARKRIAERGFA